MKKVVKFFVLFLSLFLFTSVYADIKCDEGKPGDTVNCAVSKVKILGTLDKLKSKLDNNLTFVSCDVCDDTQYTIDENVVANFKFKISENVKESKDLIVTFAGGVTAKVKVVVPKEEVDDSNEDDEEESLEKTFTVTLVPGKGKSNSTKSCVVNSMNTTCNVKLEAIDDENFTGWDDKKNCTSGAIGSVKVNKDVTYYACYKKEEVEEPNGDVSEESNFDRDVVLKSLIVKNGEEEIYFGFSIRIFEYEFEVPTDTNSLFVDATTVDDSIDIKIIGNEELKGENNKVVISLTTKDGKKNEYVLNVKKVDKSVSPRLNELVIAGYLENFNPDNYVYTIKIDKGISTLSIKHTEDQNYNVEVLGNENLKDGSIIKILVKDKENGLESTYVINVEIDNSMLYIYMAIGVGVLILLIILLVIVVKKGKKKGNSGNKMVTANNVTEKTSNKTVGKAVASSIPEVSPVVPTPSVNNNVNNDKIETLDL